VAKRTASAKKQARAGARRTVRNRGVKSEVKTLVVKARKSLGETAGAAGGAAERLAVAVAAVRSLDRAAAKGILHPNNASRRKSRLARQMTKLAAAAAAEKAPPPATKGKAAKAEPEARPSRARRLLGRS
jgi:small subunit ribosomal protein S20